MAQNLYIDGTEMTLGDNAWPTVIARQFDQCKNCAEPFKSSERILQSLFEFIKSFGEFDQPETEQQIKSSVFVIEFPNPYNHTLFIPEYGTHVNVCGNTGEQWIADDELRGNPTEHFLGLVEIQKQKLKAWQDLRGTDEVYNEQAKAINTFVLFCKTFHVPARIIIKEGNHMPDGDSLRSVYHPYMVTGTHWYLPRPSHIVGEEHLNNGVLTDEGQHLYGRAIAKQLTRESIIAK